MKNSQMENRIENRKQKTDRAVRKAGSSRPSDLAHTVPSKQRASVLPGSDWIVYKRKYRAHGALSQRHTLRVSDLNNRLTAQYRSGFRRIPVDGRPPPFPNEIPSAVAYRSCLSEGCNVIGYGRTGLDSVGRHFRQVPTAKCISCGSCRF